MLFKSEFSLSAAIGGGATVNVNEHTSLLYLYLNSGDEGRRCYLSLSAAIGVGGAASVDVDSLPLPHDITVMAYC